MASWQGVKNEIREIGLVALYFFVCFLLFLGLKKLLLSEYDVQITVIGTALIGALVVAKVVILLDYTSFGNRFSKSALYKHILWRTLTYSFAVVVVSILEHLWELSRKEGSFQEALPHLLSGQAFDHLLAVNIGVALAFLVYNTWNEIDRHLASGSLRELIFSTRKAEAELKD